MGAEGKLGGKGKQKIRKMRKKVPQFPLARANASHNTSQQEYNKAAPHAPHCFVFLVSVHLGALLRLHQQARPFLALLRHYRLHGRHQVQLAAFLFERVWLAGSCWGWRWARCWRWGSGRWHFRRRWHRSSGSKRLRWCRRRRFHRCRGGGFGGFFNHVPRFLKNFRANLRVLKKLSLVGV